jgi:hypothetical protein
MTYSAPPRHKLTPTPSLPTHAIFPYNSGEPLALARGHRQTQRLEEVANAPRLQGYFPQPRRTSEENFRWLEGGGVVPGARTPLCIGHLASCYCCVLIVAHAHSGQYECPSFLKAGLYWWLGSTRLHTSPARK